MPPMRRLAHDAMLGFAAVALAVVMTWPLAGRIDRVGRVNTGDGQWSIWVTAWVARTLVADPASLYDANIFHPHTSTLAYSEANIGAGAMAAPVYLATKNPLFAHNAVVLVGFTLSVLGAFALVAHLTGSRTAGWSAGIAYAYCPFVFARTAHIQLLMTWALPFCLLAFHRVVERPSIARGAVLGLLLFVQALLCAYYGIFAALAIGLGTGYYAWTRRHWREPRFWAAIATGAIVSIGATLPFFLPFLDVQREAGFTRTLEDASMYEANLEAWLTSAAWAHRWWFQWLPDSSEVLFPGVLTTLLGLTGLVVAARRSVDDVVPAARETAVFYGLTGALGFWVSFGPSAYLYTLFFHAIPVFSFLRAPARFGIVVVIALVVGMGLSIAWLARRWPARGRVAGFAVSALLVAELATLPLGLPEVEPPNVAYRLLATARPGPVVELPFFYQRSDFPRHAYYMLYSTYHWQPLINGYSDHIPQDFRDMVIPMSSFPTRESFALLEQRRARYAVFHLDFYDRRNREKLMQRLEQYQQYLAPLSREDDVWLYEIVGWPR